MADRRITSLQVVNQSNRPELMAQYVAVLQKRLQQQFPVEAGYQHSLDWRLASCVNPKRQSLDVQRTCRATILKVTRGRDWGIVITTTPADVGFKKLKMIASGAAPFVEGLKTWIIKIAGFIGIAVGIVAAAIAIWSHPEMGRRTVLIGLLFGVTVFLSLVLIGFLLLTPLSVIFSSYRMREPVASSMNVIEQAWAEMRGASPGLPALARKHSPALFYACWLLVSLLAGVLCFLLPNWPTLPLGAEALLGFIVAIAAVAALGTLLGVIVSLFGLLPE